MKKVLIVIAFLTVPFFASAQNETKTDKTEITVEVEANVIIKAEISKDLKLAIKKVDPISINPKKQNLDLNFKKSNDIISVKAYIKSLQIKRKATVIS